MSTLFDQSATDIMPTISINGEKIYFFECTNNKIKSSVVEELNRIIP
jgi:hypothetical protein